MRRERITEKTLTVVIGVRLFATIERKRFISYDETAPSFFTKKVGKRLQK